MLKKCGLIGLAIAILLLVGGSVVIWNFNQPPSAYYSIQNVKQGTSKNDVISLLGEPSSVQDDGKTLAYARTMGWGILYVYFDGQGNFVRYEYDE